MTTATAGDPECGYTVLCMLVNMLKAYVHLYDLEADTIVLPVEHARHLLAHCRDDLPTIYGQHTLADLYRDGILGCQLLEEDYLYVRRADREMYVERFVGDSA